MQAYRFPCTVYVDLNQGRQVPVRVVVYTMLLLGVAYNQSSITAIYLGFALIAFQFDATHDEFSSFFIYDFVFYFNDINLFKFER